jgi:hypothetical protein
MSHKVHRSNKRILLVAQTVLALHSKHQTYYTCAAELKGSR